MRPVPFDEGCCAAPKLGKAEASRGGRPTASRRGGSMPIIADPFGCQDPTREGDGPAMCCVPEEAQRAAALFAPCMVCAMRAATIVEVPCGHATVCVECYGDYQTNTRCLRCRDQVTARVDVAPFLDEISGRPGECNMCKSAPACVVTIPCVHMCLCARCLPNTPAGCPTCGARVEQTCKVKWSSGGGAAATPSAQGGIVVSTPGGTAGLSGFGLPNGRFPSLPLSVGALPTHGGSGGRDGLAEATEDVDLEIDRLERQLRRLRGLPPGHLGPQQQPSNPQEESQCTQPSSAGLLVTPSPASRG